MWPVGHDNHDLCSSDVFFKEGSVDLVQLGPADRFISI
jgi:hypothetical protein